MGPSLLYNAACSACSACSPKARVGSLALSSAAQRNARWKWTNTVRERSPLRITLSFAGSCPKGISWRYKLEGGEKPRKPAEDAMLTPDRNKALVRRWLEEVLTRGEPNAADGLFTSNYALHDPSFLH